MKIFPIPTRLIMPGDDLLAAMRESMGSLREGSVLAVTSKIVSLAEGRFVPKGRVTLETLVRQEGEKVWRTQRCWIALKDGILIPNAGVDESNAFGGFILWPKDAFASAKRIQSALQRHYNVKKLGVLITDSWTMPLRHGVTGIALGYFGFSGQKNYVGEKDLAGRKMLMTKVSLADCLASAAVLAMGEGSEQTPLALIEGAPVRFTRQGERHKLKIDPRDDVYRPVFKESFFK